jgi:eukaryotic-like serine/threonine-protein kinase
MARPVSVPPELPGYTYVSLLGAGGFSDVFLYEQRMPRRHVAIKVLVADGMSIETRRAFVAEANVMARLSEHPYIVDILHADVSADGRPYFVMKYFPGASFADRLRQAPFSIDEALRAGVKLSSAIAAAHAAGILHRDIKPANVLTDKLGWPALTDFGISATLDDAVPMHTTTFLGEDISSTSGTSQSVGMSIPWSPPEVIEGDAEPDVRSDLFSLAATIYTLLAGHSPFEVPGRSNSTNDLIARIERGDMTPLTRSDLPKTLVYVLQKGMATDPAERFASAILFARALQGVELELGYSETPLDVEELTADPRQAFGLADSGADRTTARTNQVIQAQPPLIAPPPAADRTSLRAPVVVNPQYPAAPPTQPNFENGVPLTATVLRPRAEPVTGGEHVAAPPRRAGLIAIIVAASLVLVVGAVVGVTLAIGGAPAREALPPSGGTAGVPDEGGAVIDVLEAPTLVDAVASPDRTAVTFTWEHADLAEGDSYVWRRIAMRDEPLTPTTEPVAEVSGISPGEEVCIEAMIVRRGQESAPLEACLTP